MAVDRGGSEHVFDPGWYVYVGSAHGPGGLHSRIARRQRRVENAKRMRWNVDCVRGFARLREVWSSDLAASEDELRWAEAVRNMQGATVPISKFDDKDCNAACSAHFYQFLERQWMMAFRDRLQSYCTGQPVFVAFFDEDFSHFVTAAPNQSRQS